MLNNDSVIIPPPVSTRLKRLVRTTTMVEDNGSKEYSLKRTVQIPPKPFLRTMEVCRMA